MGRALQLLLRPGRLPPTPYSTLGALYGPARLRWRRGGVGVGHLQWYLAEGARELCHGLCQAFQKRDLPRALLFDNGSAMIAAETEQGLR
jgi:hypothetical protein